jgi:molybdopterin/thiamine biosynthesis adenylyltransferase
MTGQDLIERITDENDKKILKKFVNSHGLGYILFPFGLDYAIGGVHIYGLKLNRNGYRKGRLLPFDVMTRFENKNKKIDRLLLSVYNENRLAHRTAGELMVERTFLIAGLGSVGSNLCYYLNGYNNANFILADKDWFTVDNIGRHLLGFECVSQQKSHAVANYLQQYRPDRNVKAFFENLQQMEVDEINKANAIFVCTGDVMSEKWLIDKMVEGLIKRPAFLMWLEAYGISGIMIYVNPDDKESLYKLKIKADDCFLDYCMIKREEYDDNDKLTQRDAGCNGSYALYSANDVILFLSVMFPEIDKILEVSSKSKCYRWVGNLNMAKQKGISLVSSSNLSKGMIQELAL